MGVTPKTLRLWEQEGKIVAHKTNGGHRRYDLQELLGLKKEQLLTVAYARVSSHDQKDDLTRQIGVLELYCAAKGFKNKKIMTELQKIAQEL